MIKTFLSSWDWSADAFRMALAASLTQFTRPQFTAFLKKRGTDPAQLKSAAYLLSWQFFNRRQNLGLSIMGVYFRDNYETLRGMRHIESLSGPERVLVVAQEEEMKALKERHNDEYYALQDTQDKRTEALRKTLVERWKALGDVQSPGSTRNKEGYKEQLRILADSEEQEVNALTKQDRKELDAMHEAQHQEEKALEEAHAEQLKALTEVPPANLNKRVSGGTNGGRAKRTRSSR